MKIVKFRNPSVVDMVEELKDMLELAEQGKIGGYCACFEIGDEYEIRSTVSPFEVLAMTSLMQYKINYDLRR